MSCDYLYNIVQINITCWVEWNWFQGDHPACLQDAWLLCHFYYVSYGRKIPKNFQYFSRFWHHYYMYISDFCKICKLAKKSRQNITSLANFESKQDITALRVYVKISTLFFLSNIHAQCSMRCFLGRHDTMSYALICHLKASPSYTMLLCMENKCVYTTLNFCCILYSNPSTITYSLIHWEYSIKIQFSLYWGIGGIGQGYSTGESNCTIWAGSCDLNRYSSSNFTIKVLKWVIEHLLFTPTLNP